MTTRFATPADLDAISALADEIATLHHQHQPDIFAEPDAARDRDFWLSCINQTDTAVLVATRADATLGFITAKMSETQAPTILKRRTICRIGTIVVASRAQRQGNRKELIRVIEAWGKTQSAVETRLEVFDFNRDALRFYASLGYGAVSHNLSRAG